MARRELPQAEFFRGPLLRIKPQIGWASKRMALVRTLILQAEQRRKGPILRRTARFLTTLQMVQPQLLISFQYPIAFQESGVSQFQFGWPRPVFFSVRSSTTHFFKDYPAWLT